jgi:hypothetical protein
MRKEDLIGEPPKNVISGYSISKVSRRNLMTHFPPKYTLAADHITYMFGVPMGAKTLPPTPEHAEVVGYADDGSLEALVIKIDGTVHRPSGGLFHLTWSKTKDRRSVESNTLLEHGWQPVKPISIEIGPNFFPIMNRVT